MIDKIHFKDYRPRKYVPYKGWIICSNDGETCVNDTPRNTNNDIKIETFYPASPNAHVTYNLKKGTTLILNKNVRKIQWNEAGYYIAYDNNEDEPDIFVEKYWILDRTGKYLSDCIFQYARPLPHSFIRVEISHKQNIIDLNGKFIFQEPVDCIFGFIKGLIYYVDNGKLYGRTPTGKIMIEKELQPFNQSGEYYCGNGWYIKDGNTSNGVPICYKDYFSHGYHGIWKIQTTNMHPSNTDTDANVLIKGRHLLFSDWYKNIRNNGFGIFQIFQDGNTFLITVNQEIIIANATLIISNETFIVCKKAKRFIVYDYDGKKIGPEFTSCIWVKRDGIWNINAANENLQKCYFYGQASELLDYAQNFIIRNNILALLELDSIWYWHDYLGQLHECFRNYKHAF